MLNISVCQALISILFYLKPKQSFMRKFYFFLFTAILLFSQKVTYGQVSTYTFSQAPGTYTEIAGGTVLGNTASDDERFVDPAVPLGGTVLTGPGFPIGFDFYYNGIVFDRLAVNNNGWISLGQSSLSPSVDNNSTSAYTPLSSTSVHTPTLLRNRIAGMGRDLQAQAGSELRVQTTGAAPNRQCIIQYKNYKRFGAAGTGDGFNFQIILNEATGSVQVKYGSMVFNTTTTTSTIDHVGLGGTLSTDFNNRQTVLPHDWNATIAGTTNAQGCQNATSTVAVLPPASGLTFTWLPATPPPACTAPPVGGTTVATPASACSGVNFGLSVSGGATGIGLLYQWESSPNGLAPWTPIGGATTAGLTTSQTVTTWYRRKTTCSGIDGFSNGLQVTMNAPGNCYCSASATSTSFEKISNVTFNTINNASSSTAGYEDFTALTTTVTAGLSYPATVTILGGFSSDQVVIFIDFNQDGDFTDPGETVYTSGQGVGPFTGNILIPLTASNGNTRMRVRMHDAGALVPNPTSCGVSSFGQVEDYTINIFVPPCVITCPANITVNVDPNQCGAVVNYPAPTSSGACGVLTSTPASGSFFPKGTTTVTTTSSLGGGICVFTVTVVDNQLPTITCPANITRNNDPGVCGAVVTFPAPVAADNCPGVVVTSVPASGSVFPKGTTTVTSTATDAAGNTRNCTFTVTVNDTQAPVITCPANIVKGTDPNQCGAVVTFLPTVTDNCPFGTQTPLAITQSTSTTITPANSAICGVFPIHNDNSIWRAYDLAPMALPGPFTINNVTFGIQSADAGGAATSQPVTVRLYTSAGAFPGGTRTLIASQTYTIPDQALTLFTATLTSPPTVPANAILVIELFTPDGTAAGNSFIVGSNTAAQTGTSYISAPACAITTPTDVAAVGFPLMHVVLNAAGTVPVPGSGIVSVPASGSFFPKGTTTVTSTATDNAGNTAVCTFTVTVNDTQAPAFTCPANITATTPVGVCTAVVNYTAPATDNCPGVTVVRTVGPASGSAFPIGVTTITHVATDAAGNTSSCTFTVTVADGQLPVIGTQPANRTVCSGTVPTFSVVATNTTSYQWQIWNGTAWTNITGATSATLTLPAATTAMNDNSYRVIVTGLCSSVTSGFATLFVNPLPTVSLAAAGSPVLLPTQTTGLIATVNPTGGTFAWFKNGAAYTGPTTNLGVGDVGTYRFIYTDLNGCVSTSNDVVVSAQASGNFYITPNPNVGAFSIRFFNSPNESVTVSVYNSVGEKVLSKSVTTTALAYTKIDVDLGSKISGGIYLVEVHGSDGKLRGAKRIIVGHR